MKIIENYCDATTNIPRARKAQPRRTKAASSGIFSNIVFAIKEKPQVSPLGPAAFFGIFHAV